MDPNGNLVKVRDLHKVFRRGSERIDVLQGLDLDIGRGDYVTLMGPSGPCTTILLNLLGGLDESTQGTIEVAGERIDRSQPPVIRVLRGDFFCMPFGGNEGSFRGERHLVHGEVRTD